MHDGRRILNWIQDNGHTVSWVAEKLGYSRQALSKALNHNRISLQLAEALYAHFWMRVNVTMAQDDPRVEASRRTGRRPGPHRTPRPSKLDAVAGTIEMLLNSGETQSAIAQRFGTTESNLHAWMRRRGLRRNRAKR